MVAHMSQSSARAKPALGKRIRLALVVCAALYAVACAGCAAWQRRLIYFPPVFTTAQVDDLAGPPSWNVGGMPPGKRWG